ncbi:rhodanese-like domain-containing protein [Nocardia sp. NPDC060259]|uniref:rhodanese-like domain-containing protein n=1 Tax=Nocardia sp. NPDC060259 TaxID=3347088 RepID=UPI00365780EA
MDDGFDIDVTDLKAMLDSSEPVTILDVRSPMEFDIAHLEGSLLIPMQELPTRLAELPKEKLIIVLCHHGGRSARAVAFLRSQSFDNTRNLAGGIDAWSAEIDPALPQY